MKTLSLCVAAMVAAVTLTSVAAARPESRHATDSAQASSKIAFTRGSPTDAIYVMNADGSGKRPLRGDASRSAPGRPTGGRSPSIGGATAMTSSTATTTSTS